MSGTGPQGGAPAGSYAGQAQHGPAGTGTGTGAGAGAGAGAAGTGAAPAQGTTASGGTTTSASDLNKIVTDYLLKKGFTKTEATFRKESSHTGSDGRPIRKTILDMGPERYLKAFNLLKDWIDNGLDLYKFELAKVLWPVFVYSYLDLVSQNCGAEAKRLLEALKPSFENVHADDLKTLASVTLPPHIKENHTTKLYTEHQYKIPLNQHASAQLLNFLEREADNGGFVISQLLQERCTIDSTARGPIEPYSFEAIYRRAQNYEIDDIDAQEGIPGVFTGVSNRDVLNATQPLKLGPMPMEQELREDVRAELETEDLKHPPADGVPNLVDEFDQRIKREESADAPTRADLPLPPSRAKDVVVEMQKIRENRDRFKIEGRTGGVGVPLSVCMFTFHNTCGSVTSMSFSKDHKLVAYGTTDSYVRVWSTNGKPLKSKAAGDKDVSNNRKLIGHSGPVYGVSFADSIRVMDSSPFDTSKPAPETDAKLLLSSSADGTIRLWSLETWTQLCIYKGHTGPVFRVLWGPHGHYFATAGWDRTVRVYSQDHASAQRIFVGHDTPISRIAWHPNGTYVFSASDETDKSIRMWSVPKGECVRVFHHHADYISALECSPNGKLLASADTGGNIILWDIEKGTRIKRCRGHGKGGITSLSFSVESNVLVSGGLDGTVRVWDIDLPKDASKIPAIGSASAAAAPQAQGEGAAAAAGATASDTIAVGGSGGGGDKSITVAGAGQAPTPSAPAAAAASTAGGGGGGTGKKKGKEVMITADQISAFATKKSPVLSVEFTRMNLVVAGGYYDP